MKTLLVLVMTILFAGAAPAIAQEDRDRVSTLTYDISDLLMRANDYPLPPDVAPAPGAAPSDQTAASVEQFVSLITDTVASESWKDNGGTIGSIRVLQNVLVVTQTKQNHDELAKLLGQFREGTVATMLAVRAYWIRLEPQEVSQIFAARKARANSNVGEMPEVPDAFIDKAHLYFMGQTTSFNAQTVMLTSFRDRSYVSDLTPVVSANAVAFDPKVDVARNGVTLQVMPKLMPSGDAVVLDLHSNVEQKTPAPDIKPTVASTRPMVTEPQQNVSIERIDGVSQQLHTTVRIPLSKRVLIGGMTLETGDANAAPRQLYLAIEVNAMR